MRRIGVGLWGGMSVDELLECVTAADRLGYEAVHLIESFADQFCFLSACARATERIELVTGVTTVFHRNPTSIAIAGMTVDALSHGRFRLGLGVGHREILAVRDDVEVGRPLRFERPLQRLRETIEAVRAVVEAAARNEPASYRGEIFEIREFVPWMVAHRPRFPIYVGAFFEQGLELAGELADGVMPIFVPLDRVSGCVAAVRRGAERAGRDPAAVDLACYVPCCVSEDEEAAEDAMRHLLATHMSSYLYYRRYFTSRGYGALVYAIVARTERGDVTGAAGLVTPEMAAAVTAYGSAARCTEQIDRYRAAGIELPIVYPIHPGFTGYLPDPASRAGILHTVEALGPSVADHFSSSSAAPDARR